MRTNITSNINRNIIMILLSLFLVVVHIGAISVNASAKEVKEFVTSDHHFDAEKVYESDDAGLKRYGKASLPSYYDARNNGWVTPVKNQGEYETCWSFSSMAAIETNLIKNGLAGQDIDLSENAFAYFYYNRQSDKLGYTAGDYNKISASGKNYLTVGANLFSAGIALETGAGIRTEQQSPYRTTPSKDMCYGGDYEVKDVYMYYYNINKLDSSVAKIQQAVLDHGAVICGIYMDSTYYDDTNYSYYCPISYGNHAVTIVGWDDNYKRDNFVRNPGVDGAWIVKNSYGTSEFGDEGYFHVSYADKSLDEFMAFETTTKNNNYDNCYQHDGSANPMYSYNKGNWYANVFKAKGAGSYNEELKAISVCCYDENANYEVQVYTGLTSAGKPTSGTKAFSSSVKGKLSNAGYQTIKLPSPVSLTSGEYFSITVRLTTSSGANAHIGVDTSYYNKTDDWIRYIAATDKNQSFVKVGSKWYDAGKEAKYNIRIKAYTDVTSVKSNFRLSDKIQGVSKGDSVQLSLKAADNVHRNVTWKSASSKIASVNSKGKIKGKAYGTTTISATFIAGAKKKTLKCKVTVGPARMKGFKVGLKGSNSVSVKWSKNSVASGYEVYYSTNKNGKYSKMSSLSNKKTSYTKKLGTGTYYVKMRPYRKSGKKKLYGSYTAAKEITIP